jgi:hypothetical protein
LLFLVTVIGVLGIEEEALDPPLVLKFHPLRAIIGDFMLFFILAYLDERLLFGMRDRV